LKSVGPTLALLVGLLLAPLPGPQALDDTHVTAEPPRLPLHYRAADKIRRVGTGGTCFSV